MPKAATYLPLCITVVNPPAGVMFALQRGKAELVAPVMASGDNLLMNMNCCPTESATDERLESETVANEISDQLCTNCDGRSRPVSRKTVLLMLKSHLLEKAMTGTYSFCATRDCPVVYFEEQGSHRFTTDDLRLPVGVKAKIDPIPLCYCFGFDASHIRDQISRTGTTNIPEQISALIREGLCGCEARNPAGVCCLGEVNRAAKRLTLM